MAEIARLEATLVKPLLAVDGDSFAHRAYHALPKPIRRAEGRPANMIVGFTNMLVGLWEEERPRSVVVGWDSLDTPTYRHEAFPAYQSGREFEEDLLEQLDLLPELVESFGFVCGEGAPATRPTTSSAPPSRRGEAEAAGRSSRPRIATRSSSRASGRRSCSRRAA